MVTIYHEEFLKTADKKIKEINSLNHFGKNVEAAKASLEFAKFKVAYYEQYVNDDEPTSNYKKIHEDDYITALKHLSEAIDVAYDYGILKD